MAVDKSRTDVTQLWDTVRDYIEFALIVHTNRTYWDELDTVSNDDIQLYRDAINQALEPFYDKYDNTPVIQILDQLEYALFVSVRTGMSTRYPRSVYNGFEVDVHMDRVVTNTMVVVDDFYEDLMREMSHVNSMAIRIQKQWKEANLNPAYAACQHRLIRELNEFNEYMETRA